MTLEKRGGLVFKFILGLLISIDQLANFAYFNGHYDHTISGRVGYMSLTTKKLHWVVLEAVINTLFFFDKNHCYESIEWDEITRNKSQNNRLWCTLMWIGSLYLLT